MIVNPFPEPIKTFDWKDLHRKLLQVIYIAPNPECLERYGYVYLYDIEEKITYLVHEIDGLKETPERKCQP